VISLLCKSGNEMDNSYPFDNCNALSMPFEAAAPTQLLMQGVGLGELVPPPQKNTNIKKTCILRKKNCLQPPKMFINPFQKPPPKKTNSCTGHCSHSGGFIKRSGIIRPRYIVSHHSSIIIRISEADSGEQILNCHQFQTLSPC